MLMKRNKEWLYLVIGFLGAMLGLCGVVAFNRNLLMTLPLQIRMICAPVNYWLIALVPIIVAVFNHQRLSDFDFTKDKIGSQVITGILFGLALSVAFTLIPHLLGLGEYVDNGHRYQHVWQFAYEFLYCIVAVGCVEEFVFRGFLYTHIKNLYHKDMIAVVGSSVLFGVFHLFSGNIVQMLITGCLGVLFSIFRLKIKNCSTLSLILAHGIYDALITVWASVLL